MTSRQVIKKIPVDFIVAGYRGRKMPENTNFDFLKQDNIFEGFAEQAIEAERSLQISTSTCAILCRRA